MSDHKPQFRSFGIAEGMPLYFAATLVPKRSGRPADGPQILTAGWLRQYGSPILCFPASEARRLLQLFMVGQSGRSAKACRPRLLRFVTTRELHTLDRASIPERPMNLSLLSATGVSRDEVLVSDLGLDGFVTDLREGRLNRLDPCLLFELMDPIASLKLQEVLHFPYPEGAQATAEPADYKRWRAEDPPLPPPNIFEISPGYG